MSRPVGVIFGKVNIRNFQIAIYEGSNLLKDEYLEVRHPEGSMLCIVLDISRKSKMNAKIAFDYINHNLNNEVQGELIGEIGVLGIKNNSDIYPGNTMMPRTPLNAGVKVRRASEEFISDVLGFEKRGAYVGLLRNYQIPIRLDYNDMLQRHVALLASTGGGKSYTAGIIIEEIMHLNFPVLIFDIHGEYNTLKWPNKTATPAQLSRFSISPEVNVNKVIEYTIDGKPGTKTLKLANKNLSVDDIIKLNSRYATKMSNNQIGLLRASIKYLRESKGEYTLKDITRIIELERKNPRIKQAVLQVLENIQGYGIFEEETGQDAISIRQIVNSNKVHIINLADIEEDLLREIVVAKILEDIFNYKRDWKNSGKEVRPMVLVMDECHNFVPEGRIIHTTPIIQKIAKEGRKMGLSWVLISQRPQDINKKVLSQCQTQIIMNLKNDKDIGAVSSAFEQVDKYVVSELPSLQPGRGVVCGAGMHRPLFVDFRIRKTQAGGGSADFTVTI
jgi:uncharacterized protein